MFHAGYQNPFPTKQLDCYNRTGGALEVGDVVALDLTGSAPEAQTYTAFDPATHGDEGHPFRNVVPVTASTDDGWVFLVALEAIADNEQGTFAIEGIVDVRVPDSTAVGAFLSPSAGSDSLVAEANGTARTAVALEANATGGIAAVKCRFNGDTCFGPQINTA